MNAPSLLARFDLIADTPGNIQRLRKLVVNLAIKGRLLDSPDNEGLPGERLKVIELEKQNLIKKGRMKKTPVTRPIDATELPTGCHDPGLFQRLQDITILEKGLTAIQSAPPGDYPLVVTAEGRSSSDHYDFDGCAAIIPMVSSSGHGNASLKRLHYQEGKFALGNILCAAFPISNELISARFIFEYLTAFKEELLVSKMIGTANVSLTLTKIGEVPVPIVSPAVQRRVDELMILCDRVKEAQKEREYKRDDLVAASVHHFRNSANREAFLRHAHFYIKHVTRLTASPDQIKQLRMAILDLAVRGQLVSQDGNEGCGDDVAKLARQSKQIICDEWNFRLGNPLPPIRPGEISVELPKTWCWERIGNVAAVKGGKRVPRGVKFSQIPTPHIYIRVTDMKNQTVSLEDLRFLDETTHKQLSRYIIEKTDLYVVIVGATIGKVGIIPDALHRMHLTENAAKLVFRDIDRSFLLLALQSQLVQSQFMKKINQQAQPKLALVRIETTLVPVPPLAEQRRIVAKVNELMAICDRLEMQIGITQAESSRLLESVLHNALSDTSKPKEFVSALA
jgi:type I restriction enzyme, S subunit